MAGEIFLITFRSQNKINLVLALFQKLLLFFLILFLLVQQGILPADCAGVLKHASLSTNGTEDGTLYKVKIETGQYCTKYGGIRKYTLYIPETNSALPTPPFPVVVLIHGFLMTGFQHSNNAKYFAARGFVALTPDMTRVLLGNETRSQNVKDILGEIDWLREQNKIPGSSLYGRLDPNRIGIAGSSAGGAVCLELLVAAQKANIPIQAMCSLDGVPWDRTWHSLSELERVNILSLRAEPGLCNYHARMLGYLAQLKFPYDDVKINGAHHCDTENPSSLGCHCVCGKSSEKNRAVFQRLMYLYLRDKLQAAHIDTNSETFVKTVQNLQYSGKVLSDLAQTQATELASKQVIPAE